MAKKPEVAEKELDIEMIKTLLNKDPSKRNARDIFQLSNAIKNVAFLKKYQEEGHDDVHIQCARYMKYEQVPKGQAVFHIDTVGDKFFVTLKGRVGIYIRLPMTLKKKEEMGGGGSDLTCVKELEGGFAFGELALINNKPRLASIICHEDSHFMTLDKRSFVLVLKKKEEEKLAREMGFFAKLPFFEGWNYNLIKMIYLNSFRIKYSKNERVFSEGDEPGNVYIVTEGEFVTEKEFNKTKDEDEFGFRKTEPVNHLRKEGNRQKKTIQLSVLVRNEMFGEEDVLNKCSSRTYSAFCSTVSGECIVVKKRDFELRILHEEGARMYLEDRLSKKNRHMQEKLRKIRGSIEDFSQYIYDDRDEIKTQKTISQAISRMEQQPSNKLNRRLNSMNSMVLSSSTTTAVTATTAATATTQQQFFVNQPDEDDEIFSPTLLGKSSSSQQRQPIIRKQSGVFNGPSAAIQSMTLIRGNSVVLPPTGSPPNEEKRSSMMMIRMFGGLERQNSEEIESKLVRKASIMSESQSPLLTAGASSMALWKDSVLGSSKNQIDSQRTGADLSPIASNEMMPFRLGSPSKKILRLFQIPSVVKQQEAHNEEEEEDEQSEKNSTPNLTQRSSDRPYNFIVSPATKTIFDRHSLSPIRPIKKNGLLRIGQVPNNLGELNGAKAAQSSSLLQQQQSSSQQQQNQVQNNNISTSSPAQSFSELPLISEIVSDEDVHTHRKMNLNKERSGKKKKGEQTEFTSRSSNRHFSSIEESMKYSEQVLSAKNKSMISLQSASTVTDIRAFSPHILVSSGDKSLKNEPKIIVHPVTNRMNANQIVGERQQSSLFDGSDKVVVSSPTSQMMKSASLSQIQAQAQQMRSLMSIASDLKNSPIKITSKEETRGAYMKSLNGQLISSHQANNHSASSSNISSATSYPQRMQHFFPNPPIQKTFLKRGDKTRDQLELLYSSCTAHSQQGSQQQQQQQQQLSMQQQQQHVSSTNSLYEKPSNRPLLNSSFSPMRGKVNEMLSYKFEIYKNLQSAMPSKQQVLVSNDDESTKHQFGIISNASPEKKLAAEVEKADVSPSSNNNNNNINPLGVVIHSKKQSSGRQSTAINVKESINSQDGILIMKPRPMHKSCSSGEMVKLIGETSIGGAGQPSASTENVNGIKSSLTRQLQMISQGGSSSMKNSMGDKKLLGSRAIESSSSTGFSNYLMYRQQQPPQSQSLIRLKDKVLSGSSSPIKKKRDNNEQQQVYMQQQQKQLQSFFAKQKWRNEVVSEAEKHSQLLALDFTSSSTAVFKINGKVKSVQSRGTSSMRKDHASTSTKELPFMDSGRNVNDGVQMQSSDEKPTEETKAMRSREVVQVAPFATGREHNQIMA